MGPESPCKARENHPDTFSVFPRFPPEPFTPGDTPRSSSASAAYSLFCGVCDAPPSTAAAPKSRAKICFSSRTYNVVPTKVGAVNEYACVSGHCEWRVMPSRVAVARPRCPAELSMISLSPAATSTVDRNLRSIQRRSPIYRAIGAIGGYRGTVYLFIDTARLGRGTRPAFAVSARVSDSRRSPARAGPAY